MPSDVGFRRYRIMGGRYRGNRQKWFAMRFTGSDADINLAAERLRMKGTTNSGNCSGLTHFQASNSRCDAALRHLPPGQPRRHADAVTDEG